METMGVLFSLAYSALFASQNLC